MIDKIILIFLLLFNFILAFGTFDPVFGENSLFSLIELLAFIVTLGCFLGYFNIIVHRFSKNAVYLFLLLFSLFLSSVMYGYSEYPKAIFNFKLLICIVLYIALAFIYKNNPRFVHYSLVSYSLGVFVFAILLQTIYVNAIEMDKGRLIIFGENPNSTSARFSIAVVFLFYFAIQNPFNISFYRYISLLLSLPIMLLVLQSGSRGSLISMIIGCIAIIYISNIKKMYKTIYTVLIVIAVPFILAIIADTGSIQDRLIDSFVEGDLAGRDVLWLATLDIINNNFIIGVGERGYFSEMQRLVGGYRDAHNLFLYLLASGGIIAFCFFMLFYKNLIIQAYCVFKEGDVLPLILLVNMTIIAVKTGGVLTYTMLWVVFAMISSYRPFERNSLETIKKYKGL